MSIAHSAQRCLWPLLALLLCGVAWPAEEPTKEPGPWVEVSLRDQVERVTGFLLESRDGTVTLIQEKDHAKKDFPAARIETLNFDRPMPLAPPAQAAPKKNLTKTAEAAPKTREPEPKEVPKRDVGAKKNEDAAKDSGERPAEPERFARREFYRKRALERLTPEEKKRFDELLDRLHAERKDLPQAEEDELHRLFDKLGLLDPFEYHQQVHQAVKDATAAQDLGKMDAFVQAHEGKLRQAATDEERRKHLFGLFAAAYVQNSPPDKFLPRIVEILRQSDPRAREKPAEEIMKSQRENYGWFAFDAKRAAPVLPWRPRFGERPKAP
jgi:hypothetical protein